MPIIFFQNRYLNEVNVKIKPARSHWRSQDLQLGGACFSFVLPLPVLHVWPVFAWVRISIEYEKRANDIFSCIFYREKQSAVKAYSSFSFCSGTIGGWSPQPHAPRLLLRLWVRSRNYTTHGRETLKVNIVSAIMFARNVKLFLQC